jgi:uncharacterized Zn finger protein (UPF0148 family)
MRGWIAPCPSCEANLQVITDGQEAFDAKLAEARKQTGARIVALRNEAMGAWALLPEDDGAVTCPVCHKRVVVHPPLN